MTNRISKDGNHIESSPFDQTLEDSTPIEVSPTLPVYNIAGPDAVHRDPRKRKKGCLPEWCKVTLHRSGSMWAEIVFHNGIAVSGRAHTAGSPLRASGDWRPIKNLKQIASNIEIEDSDIVDRTANKEGGQP